MRCVEIDLKGEGYPVKGGTLEGILANKLFDFSEPFTRPAVIVVPGGGYEFVSVREGEPVASFFLSKGYQVFVLRYLISKAGVSYPEQLVELASAVDYVKKHAQEFNVNPEEVFAVGFSAGGHLTGNLAVDWQNVSKIAGVALDCKPTAVGLSYPVITSKVYAHFGSFKNLLQNYTPEEKEELQKQLNLEEKVSSQTPPTFLWTTAKDRVVPSQNALLFALALANNGIDYELHVYPEGDHGASTCDFEINAHNAFLRKNAGWLENCASFFRIYTKEEY